MRFFVAAKKVLVFGLLCIPVVAYSHYGLSKLTVPSMVTLYVLPFAAVAFVQISTRFRVALNISLYSSACILVVGIYAIEYSLIFQTRYEHRIRAYAAKHGYEPDLRVMPETARDLRAKGTEAYITAKPASKLITIDGRGKIQGLSEKANSLIVFCNEIGKPMTYQSDKYGFNNPPGIWDAGEIDVAFLGDSHIYGHCEETPNSIVGQVRKYLPKTLSVSTNTTAEPLSQYAAFIEYVRPVKPKWVVWQVSEQDVLEFASRFKNSHFAAYLFTRAPVGLRELQDPIDQSLKKHIDTVLADPNISKAAHRIDVTEFLKLKMLRRHLLAWVGRGDVQNTGREAFVEIDKRSRKFFFDLMPLLIGMVRQDVEGWGGHLGMMYFPLTAVAARSATHKAEVVKMFTGLGVTVIDASAIIEDYEKQGGESVYYQGTHTTVQMNAFLGKTISCRLAPDKC